MRTFRCYAPRIPPLSLPACQQSNTISLTDPFIIEELLEMTGQSKGNGRRRWFAKAGGRLP
jgi:hypothetical protein